MSQVDFKLQLALRPQKIVPQRSNARTVLHAGDAAKKISYPSVFDGDVPAKTKLPNRSDS